MPVDKSACVKLLSEIGSVPVAPFHEKRMMKFIENKLAEIGIPFRQDKYGNIIAVYEGPNAPSSGGIGLGAHMDHPAIEITGNTSAYLLGSIRKEFFNTPIPILAYPSNLPASGLSDMPIKGIITDPTVNPDRSIHFNLSLKAELSQFPAFGVWDMPAVKFKNDQAWMRAVDDVAGCAIVLLVLQELVKIKASCRCYGIFTRSEEVGFVGVTALMREKIIPKDIMIVSIETSKTLPDAIIGGGPVIRTGDTIATFDHDAEFVLLNARDRLIEHNPDRKVQRQLMSGGGCEGTIYMLNGYCTTGLAIPLGNYHNMGENRKIMPEYVDLNDFASAVDLLTIAAFEYENNYKSELFDELSIRAEKKHHRLID